jgi:hypothetical protein
MWGRVGLGCYVSAEFDKGIGDWDFFNKPSGRGSQLGLQSLEILVNFNISDRDSGIILPHLFQKNYLNSIEYNLEPHFNVHGLRNSIIYF